MKKSIKTKWVAALRSGEYKQTRNALEHSGAFCCLGVLACVVDPERKTWNGSSDGVFGGATGIFDHTVEKQSAQAKLIGGLIPHARMRKLIDKNDDGDSFENIASYIERYL
jgi:hypothetical protein